jgi:hypothetical protein
VSRYFAPLPRACPFPQRAAWAVYKAGCLWRVQRPARAWACHEVDAWSGDFATHAEALAWATSPAVRWAWLVDPDNRFKPDEAESIAWVEGFTAECVAARSSFAGLFLPEKGAA